MDVKVTRQIDVGDVVVVYTETGRYTAIVVQAGEKSRDFKLDVLVSFQLPDGSVESLQLYDIPYRDSTQNYPWWEFYHEN